MTLYRLHDETRDELVDILQGYRELLLTYVEKDTLNRRVYLQEYTRASRMTNILLYNKPWGLELKNDDS